MPSPTVLLLASHPSLAEHVAALLRRGGFEVMPGWFNDRVPQPLAHVPVDVVLVDLQHHAARSPAFCRMAAQLGVTLVYFIAGAPDDHEELTTPAGAEPAAPVLRLGERGDQFTRALQSLMQARERSAGGR